MNKISDSHRIKTNYFKYDEIKQNLLEELETQQRARTIAEKLGISIHTFHKYKNYLQFETKKIMTTIDEMVFLEKQQKLAKEKASLKEVSKKNKDNSEKVVKENISDPQAMVANVASSENRKTEN